MSIPDHHKNIAKHLREKFGEPATVAAYRDDRNQRPISVGEFGRGKNRFVSTIGMCDKSFRIPSGHYEFTAIGELPWLPNAITSSIYWLEERSTEQWPLICEDVVKQNAKSKYRHMLYVPSQSLFRIPSGPSIKWLLGAPLMDSEIALNLDEASQKIRKLYPSWFFESSV